MRTFRALLVLAAIVLYVRNGVLFKRQDVPVVTLSRPPEIAAVSAAATPTPDMVAYVVQPGDNLLAIAQIYGVTVDAIIQANGITDPGLIYAGQTLLIPLAAGAAAAPVQATLTPQPTAVLSTLAATPTPAPPTPPGTLPPPPTAVNGISLDTFIVMPEPVRQHIREIYAHGQTLGNNPRAFSKVGDSTIENPHFLARFDSNAYNLGDYAYLQLVINYFSGSFSRQGMAVRRGLHSWTVMDAAWADNTYCRPNEGPVACEFRLHRPSIIFIRLGANDVGVPESFNRNIRQLVEFALARGVIPVLGTKADRREGAANINNTILRQLAAEYAVPLWDFDLLAGTLPGRGLDQDGVHMTTFFAHDYTSPLAMQRGHAVHNLSALMVLDAIWRELMRAEG